MLASDSSGGTSGVGQWLQALGTLAEMRQGPGTAAGVVLGPLIDERAVGKADASHRTIPRIYSTGPTPLAHLHGVSL